jgi:Rrf2 family protein
MRNVMKISARTDYALRVLLELASDTSEPMTCEGIADTQQIPYRFLKSVVGDLRRAGLVASQRGCDGGYWLAQNAANISVAEVVEAVDGSVLNVRGEVLERLGYQGTAEPLDLLWGALQSYVDALFATTIAQLGAGRLAAGVPGRPRARAQVAAVS